MLGIFSKIFVFSLFIVTIATISYSLIVFQDSNLVTVDFGPLNGYSIPILVLSIILAVILTGFIPLPFSSVLPMKSLLIFSLSIALIVVSSLGIQEIDKMPSDFGFKNVAYSMFIVPLVASSYILLLSLFDVEAQVRALLTPQTKPDIMLEEVKTEKKMKTKMKTK